MNSSIAVVLIIVSGLLAAVSQLMLKKSAMQQYPNLWREYLNKRVIGSYALLFATTLINMYAMMYVPYKIVPIVGTVSYVFVVLFSKIFLKEKIDLKKWIGAGVIIGGIVVFNL